MSISIKKLSVDDVVFFDCTIRENIVNMRGRHLSKKVRTAGTVKEVNVEEGFVIVSSRMFPAGKRMFRVSNGSSIGKLFAK